MVNAPTTPDGVTYSVDEAVVTATINPVTHEWDDLTEPWFEVDASTGMRVPGPHRDELDAKGGGLSGGVEKGPGR